MRFRFRLSYIIIVILIGIVIYLFESILDGTYCNCEYITPFKNHLIPTFLGVIL